MAKKEQAVSGADNCWQYAFRHAGIPKSFHDIKYSAVKKHVLQDKGDNTMAPIKKFMEKKCQGIFFINMQDDYTLPYVVFRRLMTLRLFILNEAKILSSYEIQNKRSRYNYEKLLGIFRIDINFEYNKSILVDNIMRAYKDGAQMIITSTESKGESLATYFDTIWDIFEKDFEVVRL